MAQGMTLSVFEGAAARSASDRTDRSNEREAGPPRRKDGWVKVGVGIVILESPDLELDRPLLLLEVGLRLGLGGGVALG